MGIRKATTTFLTKPGLGRAIVVSGAAGAGAAALAHLINMPEEEQEAGATVRIRKNRKFGRSTASSIDPHIQ